MVAGASMHGMQRPSPVGLAGVTIVLSTIQSETNLMPSSVMILKRRAGSGSAVDSLNVASGVAVVLHERLGNWSRQLQPRLHGRAIRWFETRTEADLDRVLAGRSCPISVVDLSGQPQDGLAAIDRIRCLAPGGLILALDSQGRDEICRTARHFGSTHVFSGAVPPPVVARLLSRWVDLASIRASRGGWARTEDLDDLPEPWNWLTPYLKASD